MNGTTSAANANGTRDMNTPNTLESLLARASTMTCANAAQTYMDLVPQITRFQIALDTLLPLLSDSNQVCGRIRRSRRQG